MRLRRAGCSARDPSHAAWINVGMNEGVSMGVNWSNGDRLLRGATVDRLIDGPRSRKYALMKRLFDPFPQSYSIGRSSRWLASEVYAWLDRRLASSPSNQPDAGLDSGTPTAPLGPTDGTGASVETTSTKERPNRLDIRRARELYEAGWSADSICRELQVGKRRLLNALHDEGVAVRRPGRRNSVSMPPSTSVDRPWPTEVPEARPVPMLSASAKRSTR